MEFHKQDPRALENRSDRHPRRASAPLRAAAVRAPPALASGEEEARRVLHLGQAVLGHAEKADLVH